MTVVEQIDYMIQSLQVAKDEIEYAQEYELLPDVEKYDDSIRTPNGTIIREALKMVGRMAYISANKVSLSPYCSELFKEWNNSFIVENGELLWVEQNTKVVK